MKKILISSTDAGQKLIPFLRKVLPLAPSSFFYKMMRRKNITVNQSKVQGREILAAGDIVYFWLSDDTFKKFSADKKMVSSSGFNFSSLIIYEDEDFLFASKPTGMLSQSDHSGEPSFNDLLVQYVSPRSYTRPSIANRLDRNTSGLILCGKSVKGLQYLARVLHDRSILKTYLLLAYGHLSKKGSFRSFFAKNEEHNKAVLSDISFKGSAIVQTDYELIQQTSYKMHPVAFASAHLITGKTHQIRAQFASNGCPLLGDVKYGSRDSEALSRLLSLHCQMLHSYSVQFPEDSPFPSLSGKTFHAPLPSDFSKALQRLGFHSLKEGTL